LGLIQHLRKFGRALFYQFLEMLLPEGSSSTRAFAP
jgi:hypothetical protein